MSGAKLMLMFTILLAVIALSVWGVVTAGAEGAPQPNTPAAASGSKADDDDNGGAKDDSDGPITPGDAEKASAAALRIAGGGTVQDIEKGDDGNPAWFEVEIQKADGTEVKVQLDENFNQRRNTEESESGDDGQEGKNDD